MTNSDSGDANRSGIAILGGSFDPVHVGHLWMAEAAFSQLPVDHVRWFPAATSPLKPGGPVASNDQRWRMLQLAIAGQNGHVADDFELRRDGVSYTVETLRHLREAFPDRPLFLIIGADSLASFDRWREPAEILSLCSVSVIARGGHEPPDDSVLRPFATQQRISEMRNYRVSMPQIEISSRDLRTRIGTGNSIRFQVPHAVAAMIEAERIYRSQELSTI